MKKQRGLTAVKERKSRPVANATPYGECKLCTRPLDSLLRDRDVGCLEPCLCKFCFTGGDATYVCPGIFNTMMANSLHGRTDKAARCPACQQPALRLQRLGPKRVVEVEALPLSATDEQRRQMLREKPEQWGVKRLFRPVPQTAAKHEAEAEERDYREVVLGALEDRGLVAALSTRTQCEGLDAFLRTANGEKGPVARWFSSRLLADSGQRAGGTVGLLAGEYSSVADCCGSDNSCWSAAERAEAVSYVCHRMVDTQVWPEKMRGRLLRPAV